MSPMRLLAAALIVSGGLLSQANRAEPIRGDPPLIYAFRDGTNMVVKWTGNFLQGATNLAGPWSILASSTNRYSEPLRTQAARFFREVIIVPAPKAGVFRTPKELLNARRLRMSVAQDHV